jgi:hypothetical protein
MASVQVPAHWVGQNYLPPICARHGGPATTRVPRKFYTRAPGWTYVLILISVLIFAIVTLSIRKTVPTALPACGQCTRDRWQFIALAISGWVAVVAIWVVAGTFASSAIFLLGLVASLAALVFTFAGDYFRVAGAVNNDLVWVTLKRVDATFAAAINNAVRPPAAVAVATATLYQASQQYQQYQPSQNILPGQ